MPEEKLQTLSLQVINGSELESGRAARCLFTQQGNVGHAPECHWSVQDRQHSIPAQAFTIILHDGTFCLRPQTVQLWLNQAKVTATSDLIQLRQGDEIQIGRLMMRVHLNRGDIPHYDEEMATPETIVTNRDMLTDTLLSTEGAPHYPGMTHRHQLADTVVNGFSADPLQALQSESLITTGDPLSGIAAVRPSAPLSDPASNGGINSPFMDLPPIYASPGDRNDDVSAAEMAQSDGRTPLAAVSADMVADYHAQLGSADMTLWQQVEKSVLLAPYWLDGHCLSAQTALRLGYKQVADAIRDEVIRFLERLPQLTGLLFNDHTPFISEQTKQWLAASPDAKVAPVAQIGEESKAARACFAEQGLEAALRYLDMLPEGDPRDQFHRQYLAAQLTEEAGLVQLAQQQYRMLFRMGLQMMVADWEPSLLEQLEQKFTAEQ